MNVINQNKQFYSQINRLSLAGLVSACAYAYLAWQSQHYGQADLFDLYLSCGVAATVSLFVWCHYHNQNKVISISSLLLWAFIFRAMGVFSVPVLEDDFYRYLWDAYRFINDGSPYNQAPADFFDVELDKRFEDILSNINYPEIPTVYAPVLQWLFALCYLIAPGEVWPLQAILALCDYTLVCILLRLAPAKYVLLYAWNPLIIKEFAFTAHPDVLGVLFLFAALLVFRKRLFVAAVLLGLAVTSKIFAIVIAPLLPLFNWRAWIVFITTCLVVSLPFLNDFVQMTSGLRSMAELWLFNAPVYFTLLYLVPPFWLKMMMLTVFTSLWCAYAWKYIYQDKSKTIPRGDILFGLLLLCIPVANPWYFVWILAFAVIYPSYWAWVSSLAVLLSYIIGLNIDQPGLEPYQQPLWAITLEYSLIFLALIIDVYPDRLKIMTPRKKT